MTNQSARTFDLTSLKHYYDLCSVHVQKQGEETLQFHYTFTNTLNTL